MKHVGDLEISDLNYGQFMHLEEVIGSLTIAQKGRPKDKNGIGQMTLPSLMLVHGNLDILYPFGGPQLISVSGDLFVDITATITAPHLVMVGGGAVLSGMSNLPSLLSVIGDLRIYDLSMLHGDENGDVVSDHSVPTHCLGSLSSVNGALVIHADVELPKLTAIGRYFHIGFREKKERDWLDQHRVGSTARLPVLCSVNASFTVIENAKLIAPMLTLLGGDASFQTDSELPSLTKILGGLSIRHGAHVRLSSLRSVSGNIEINGRADLSSLSAIGKNLTIKSSNIDLPRLTEVGGSLETSCDSQFPVLQRIGQNLSMSYSIELPSLQYLGGRVNILRRDALVAPRLSYVCGAPYPDYVSTHHPGNLEIDASNAERWKWLAEIAGDLTLRVSAAFPSLTRVHGNLIVGSDTEDETGNVIGEMTVRLPLLRTVGGALLINRNFRTYLPELLAVEGNCTLGFTREWFVVKQVPSYLPKLIYVGGDFITKEEYSLPALSIVDGSMETGGGEFPSLSEVGKMLEVRGEANLPALTRVGGDVNVKGNASLDKLVSVGGGLFVWERTRFPALIFVGRKLHVFASCWFPILSEVGEDVRIDSYAELPTLTRIKGRLEINENAKMIALTEVCRRILIKCNKIAQLPRLAFVDGSACQIGLYKNANHKDFIEY